jgi:5-methylcytosine-specific restriction endonuclease McrBC GTP-binding regulatory subunit McrB
MRKFFKKYRHKILIGRIIIPVLIVFLCASSSACTVFGSIKDFFTERFSIEDDVRDITSVLDSFFHLIKDEDYRRAYQYLSSGDRSQGTLEDFKQDIANVTDIISVNINYVEVNNDTAVAGIDMTDSYDGEEKIYKDMEVSLVREEDGSWKIVFWDTVGK